MDIEIEIDPCDFLKCSGKQSYIGRVLLEFNQSNYSYVNIQ